MFRNFEEERVGLIAKEILNRIGKAEVNVGLVLGSGLGTFADEIKDKITIDYGDIGFPEPGAVGHVGKLYYTKIGSQGVLIFAGRAHYYEGHDLQDTVLCVRAACFAGAKTFVLTCASGAVNPDYRPGQLVVIKDHLNLNWQSPLRGLNNPEVGNRFVDMSEPYDADLRNLAQWTYIDMAKDHGDYGGMREGVYAMMPGPEYETPAQINMLRILGADMAGMSTAAEVIALRHLKARVLGISCITNMGAGMLKEKIDHSKVVETGNSVAKVFVPLVRTIIERLPTA